MKIPTQAKKVFTGKIFDVYQWPQKMFDGSTATFEMLKRPNTVQIIATQKNKIILSREEQPNLKRAYSFLGGRMNEGETPLCAAKRELLEESGFVTNDWKKYYEIMPTIKMDWIIYYFIARDCKKIQEQNLDPGEKIKLLEVNFDDFIDIILSEKYWSHNFSLHIAQLKIRNRLDELRTLLFKK